MASRNVRGRPISWRISQDRRVNDLRDPWAMLAYTWMIPSADNMGRIEGDPDLLASMIFPRQRDTITPERMSGILKILHESGLIFWYQVSGEWFIQFPEDSWEKHQKLVGNMKRESEFPGPNSDDYQEWINVTRVRTGSYRHMPSENTSMNEFIQIKEGKGEKPLETPSDQGIKPVYTSSYEYERVLNEGERRGEEGRGDLPSLRSGSTAPADPPTNRDMIGELGEVYRSSVPESLHRKGDFAFIGRLYNDFGYDRVLEGINTLAYRFDAGETLQNPLVYLRGVLKNPQRSTPTETDMSWIPEVPFHGEGRVS